MLLIPRHLLPVFGDYQGDYSPLLFITSSSCKADSWRLEDSIRDRTTDVDFKTIQSLPDAHRGNTSKEKAAQTFVRAAR